MCHCHSKLNALLQRPHRLVLVALHVQQSCAVQQYILLEGREVVRCCVLLVERYGPLERVECLKHLV